MRHRDQASGRGLKSFFASAKIKPRKQAGHDEKFDEWKFRHDNIIIPGPARTRSGELFAADRHLLIVHGLKKPQPIQRARALCWLLGFQLRGQTKNPQIPLPPQFPTQTHNNRNRFQFSKADAKVAGLNLLGFSKD
jgi:hypothetical protein